MLLHPTNTRSLVQSFKHFKMQIKAFTLALLASLASASAVLKHNWVRQLANGTAPSGVAAPSGISGVAQPTAGIPISSPMYLPHKLPPLAASSMLPPLQQSRTPLT
jgi:hypothetical protein